MYRCVQYYLQVMFVLYALFSLLNYVQYCSCSHNFSPFLFFLCPDMRSCWSRAVCMQPCGWNSKKVWTHRQEHRWTITLKTADMECIIIFRIPYLHILVPMTTTKWRHTGIETAVSSVVMAHMHAYDCCWWNIIFTTCCLLKTELCFMLSILFIHRQREEFTKCQGGSRRSWHGQMLCSWSPVIRNPCDYVTENVLVKTSWMGWKGQCQRLLFRLKLYQWPQGQKEEDRWWVWFSQSYVLWTIKAFETITVLWLSSLKFFFFSF